MYFVGLPTLLLLPTCMYVICILYSTLCPNKSDVRADFLITCNKVYRVEHNFMNTYPYVGLLQRIMQSFWKIHLSATEKSNRKQNHKRTTVQLQLVLSLTMTMLKSDVQSVRLFRGYSTAVR